nr:hypothetical protein 1634Bnrm3_p012 [Cryptomonas sp.]
MFDNQNKKKLSLMTLVYIQMEVLKFLFFSLQALLNETKRVLKIRTYTDNNGTIVQKTDKIISGNISNIEKFYRRNKNLLKEWNFEEIYNSSESLPVNRESFQSNLSKNEFASSNSFYNDNIIINKKMIIKSETNAHYKELTKAKVPQKKRKSIYCYKKMGNLLKKFKNRGELKLNVFPKFYKIQLIYFSSLIFNNSMENIEIFENNKYLVLDQKEKSLNKKISEHSSYEKIPDTGNFNYQEISTHECFLIKFPLIKKIISKILRNELKIEKNKCGAIFYINLNINFLIERKWKKNKIKKFLSMISFYEKMEKYKMIFKQFIPLGDIYCFFSKKN